jgi:hypothetical protein
MERTTVATASAEAATGRYASVENFNTQYC